MAEKRLYDAAAKGDEKTLHELLQEDPLLLNRVSYTSPNKTPLHIAAIHGHLSFVQELLNHNTHLAEELDSQQSSALHVASGKGYVAIVKQLLSAAPDMCMSRDSQGRTPLHLAAIKGHVLVLEELIKVAPFAAREKMDRGLSLLHLCVKYGQFEALRILILEMNELLNWKDDDGDTILHVAVRDKQIQTINFLLTVTALEVNALNLRRMTAMDVLIQSRRDAKDSEIEESLKRAGAFVTMETNIPPHTNQSMENNSSIMQDEWFDKQRSALMIVASLIATMAFQVAINPPGGIWQDDKFVDSQGDLLSTDENQRTHLAGYSIMAQNSPTGYTELHLYNTISFIASLSIILLLISGLPIRRRFFMWILIIITWVAIITIGITYIDSIMYVRPTREINPVVTGVAFLSWLGIMALFLIFGHATRLILKLVKKLRRRR